MLVPAAGRGERAGAGAIKQFRPIGGLHEEQANVRVIAASNRALERQVELIHAELHDFLRDHASQDSAKQPSSVEH